MALEQAIDRSKSHDERVRFEYEGTREQLLEELAELYCGYIDHATENDGTIDVWGWTEEMNEGEMSWRLCVTLV